MKKITSDQNPTLRKAIRLHESRGRRQQQRIIIFGQTKLNWHGHSNITFSEVFVCESRLGSIDQRLMQELQAQERTHDQFDAELFGKLSFGDRNDGMVATANRPCTELQKIAIETDALFVVIEAVEKPGNVGAVFRSADAAGVKAILLADARCDAFHPNAIRSSLGAVFPIPWAAAPSETVRDFLIDNQFQIAARKVDAETNYFSLDLTGRTAIVLGSEHDGLTPVWNGGQIHDVTIP